VSVHLAATLGATMWFVIFLLQKFILFLSDIPYSYFFIPDISMYMLVTYYLIIFLIVNRAKFKLSKGLIYIIILLFLNFLIWAPVCNKPINKLQITFLNVGHGTAIFIQFPKGETMLIDSGSKTSHIDKGKDIVVPYLWHKGKNTIDCMLITHGDLDHFGGAATVIDRVDVNTFLHYGKEGGEENYGQLLDLVKSRNIKTYTIKENEAIEGIDGVKILALNPSREFISNDSISKNDSSIVLKIIYKDVSLLLCADILEKGIKNIVSYGKLLKSDIIYVPHHGSDINKNISGQLYNLVKPKVSIISASKKYRYMLPSKLTLGSLTRVDSLVYVTDDHGAISITTDGKKFSVTTTCGDTAI
jgi:competence protein ComEC